MKLPQDKEAAAEAREDRIDRRHVRWCAYGLIGMVVLLVVFYVLMLTRAHAQHNHNDNWIGRGGLRNQAGAYCCGQGDCFVVTGVKSVSLPAPGYRLPGGEFVHQSESLPSEDGKFWRCQQPDGSRRCFFAPINSM